MCVCVYVGGLLLQEALDLRAWCLESDLVSAHERLPLGKFLCNG